MIRKTPWLCTPKTTAEILRKHDLRPNKRFGQNFLIDPNIAKKILAAADVSENDTILEIGPGIGTLTQYLACRAKEVTAVETDKKLIPVLKDTLRGFNNVSVINADILKTDIREIIEKKDPAASFKIVSNLPYCITTPVIMMLLENHYPFKLAVLMVQKEVAMRMISLPGDKAYGALSLAVGYYSEPKLVAKVSANCFMPKPEVSSAVVRLDKKDRERADFSEKLLFEIIRRSFSTRRKTLANSLKALPCFQKEDPGAILADMGLNENVRGESLELDQFIGICRRIGKQ